MARNTSAYSSSSRAERPHSSYYAAPPPTAKKAPEPEPTQQPFTSEFERSSRSYAQAGKGEKTFFSSTGLGRSQTMRTPSGTTRPNVNANTSSPTSGRSGRYRSASPKARRNPNNYDSTSSSESEEDMPKPKAVPKSRLRAHQKFTDFHGQQTESPKNGKRPMRYQHLNRPHSHYNRDPTQDVVYLTVAMLSYAKHWRERAYLLNLLDKSYPFKNHADKTDPKGHASDSAAFPKSSFRPTQQPNSSGSSSSIKCVHTLLVL